MAIKKCPGMDPAYFKPEDIQMHRCLECGQELEFWKDDVKLKCAHCGQNNFNPNLGNTCLVWCKEAAKCVGNDDINEWIEKHNLN
ncbi:hypothetical protein H8E88_25075 [candidate division KSB1 bacterium]|nr:hypothetical protein [candidate division KSB1 bacterium]MBL7092466.1 hypothetical protein [candidate division KSB1 bacterium]